jgi:DNA-binding GntR family transcriptional regulator
LTVAQDFPIRSTTTARTVDALRAKILGRELSPGQQVRQEELAYQLGVSRGPLREALRTLESEGLVRHSANQGYFVTSLNRSDLEQIYLMRRLLETEVLKRLPLSEAASLAELRAANDTVATAVDHANVRQILLANRAFHFLLFRLAGLEVVVQEIEKLWHLSEAYRAAYLGSPETRIRVVREHAEMIEALGRHDLDGLIAIADRHRTAAETSIISVLFD